MYDAQSRRLLLKEGGGFLFYASQITSSRPRFLYKCYPK
ncbi:hypothetical protein BN137_416 [Cronobacter condimenti 1330]|uniref:Uncharacterized protein n=1 Tax=Cronobacter condimenti 1330 TaxID=1073999 RepID=K7ZXN6_9ENTR|nr:hypothetical protein BN137_416 [Cronobacter condimenti 1330]